jgi:hypothetical protein
VKKKIITISIMIVVELAVLLMICGLNGVFTENLGAKDVVRFLCDGFFAPGLLYICLGGLVWVSKLGTFDGLGFTVSHWKQSLFNNRRDWHKEEDYYNYKKRQAEKKKNRTFNEFLIVGGASVTIASVLLIVYNCAF